MKKIEASASYIDDTPVHDALGPPSDHVRITGLLYWFFNDAGGDLGLRSNFTEGGGGYLSAVAAADAAEDGMIDALDDSQKWRACKAVLDELSDRDQQSAKHSFEIRRWSAELQRRPIHQRWLAASSSAVRLYLASHGKKTWSLEAGEVALVSAESSRLVGPPLMELVRMKNEAWRFSEKEINGLMRRFQEASEKIRASDRQSRNARIQKHIAKLKRCGS